MIESIPFTLIDIGASGGIQERWKSYSNMMFVGFEPDERDWKKRVNSKTEKWINKAVYKDRGEYKFYCYRAQCNSSMLKPNFSLINKLTYENADFEVEKEVSIVTDCLDEICPENSVKPHVVKIDTQGTELAILQGGSKQLDENILLAEIEVEFLPLYEDQPLFSEVESFMRSKDFVTLDLGNFLYVKGKNSFQFSGRKSHLISGDALFLKKPEVLIKKSSQYGEHLVGLIPVLHAYGYIDIAFDIFSGIKETNPKLYEELSSKHGDLITLIESKSSQRPWLKISERKYFKLRSFFEKRIKNRKANWNYGLGNRS